MGEVFFLRGHKYGNGLVSGGGVRYSLLKSVQPSHDTRKNIVIYTFNPTSVGFLAPRPNALQNDKVALLFNL